MPHVIETTTVPEMRLLYMRRRIVQAEIATALGEILPAVYGYVMKEGIAMQGPPTCRYSEWSAGGLTIEAGIPVASDAEGTGEILAATIAGGPVASTIHVGPYDTLHRAHEALEAYLTENNLTGGSHSVEIYLTDPGQVPNPEEWQTQVYRPIAD